MSEKRFNGVWRILELGKKKYSGILSLQEDRILLSLDDYYPKKHNGSFTQESYETILGRTGDGKLITLHLCVKVRETNRADLISGCQVLTKIFLIDRVLIGNHFSSVRKMKFNRMTITFDSMSEWMNISGFKSDYKHNEFGLGINVIFDPPKIVNLKIKRGIVAQISFSLEKNSIPKKSIAIQQKVFLSIVCKKKIHLTELIAIKNHFLGFFTFALQKNTFVEQVFVSAEERANPNKMCLTREVEVIEINPNLFSEFKSTSNILFFYTDISSNCEKIIQNWFLKEDKLKRILPSLFGWINRKSIYLEYNFISLVHALEGFHRLFVGEQYMERDLYEQTVYKPLIGSIPPDLDRSHKNSLCNKILYGYEYSLRKRLTYLFSKYAITLNLPNSPKLNSCLSESLEKIINTRNYLVHVDNSLKSNVCFGKELFDQTFRCAKILQIALLRELGFSKNQIIEIFTRSYGTHF